MHYEILKHIDSIGIDDSLTDLSRNNVLLYVVEKNRNGIEVKPYFKTHNVVVDQGRFLLLQRLTGVPGTPDYSDKPVHYFAAGYDSSGGPCSTPTPESPTDTDLVNKIAPAPTAPPVGTWYIDISSNLTYETINRLRFTIVLDATKYPDGTTLNEFGLFGGNGTDFVLFARFVSAPITITATTSVIIDWWITLPVNIS